MYISKVAYVSAKNLEKLQNELNKAEFDSEEHYDNSYDYELWIEVEEEVLEFLNSNYLTNEEVQQINKNEVDSIIFY